MRRKQQRGSAMLEFAFAGIASIFILIGTFSVALGMWNYHTLATAVHDSTRYIAVRGSNCRKAGNSCAVTVGTIAQQLAGQAIGIPTRT